MEVNHAGLVRCGAGGHHERQQVILVRLSIARAGRLFPAGQCLFARVGVGQLLGKVLEIGFEIARGDTHRSWLEKEARAAAVIDEEGRLHGDSLPARHNLRKR